MTKCFTSTYAECSSETDDPSRDKWFPMGPGLGLLPGEKWPTDWRCHICMKRINDSMVFWLKANLK